MAHSDEYIRKAIRALEAEKAGVIEQLRLVEVKIAQLEQILREQAPPPMIVREPGEPAPRGEAEREILQMLATGGALTAAEIAKRRGTSSNAASNILRRLYKRGVIESLGGGRYQNKVAPGGAQGSLPMEGG